MEDYEILSQIQMAMNLKIEKSFETGEYKFTTANNGEIVVEKKIPGTNWFEVIGKTTLKDLPDFCNRNTTSPTIERLGLLFKDFSGTDIRSGSCDTWSIRPPGSE